MYLYQHPWYVCWLVLPYLVMDNRILWQLYPNITVGIQSSPSIGIEIDLKKTNCDKINAAISFWILPPEVLWSKKISYNSNSWFRRDSKQRVSIISEPCPIYLPFFIIRELSYVIRGLFQNLSVSQPKCVWWFPSLPGFCRRLKVCWNCFDQTPSQVNKNVQKRSVISMALLGLQDTISWMFVNTSSNKSTFKVFYYKYWNQI